MSGEARTDERSHGASPNVLGVILARAGSAGLGRKHLRELLGRPVIDYTFEAAQAAATLVRVVLSTDCPELRQLARQRYIQAIARPAALATETASVQKALLHALEQVEARGSFRADAVVILYGNVPVRSDGVIDRCVRHLLETACDSVRSFCPVGKWHPAWMSRLGGPAGDEVQALAAGSIDRRQDLEPLYLHDGGCVAIRRESLLLGRELPEDPHAMFGSDRRGIVVGEGETVEIDSERDLLIAEAALRARGIGRRGTRMAA